MKIFCAIDIIDGKVVRLTKGDYKEKTVYSDSIESVMIEIADKGCRFIHLVDLDAAKEKKPVNNKIIIDSVAELKRIYPDIYVEIGGGIRDFQTAEMYLNNGIDRIIIGTAAIEDKNLLKTLTGLYSERVAVGADLKDGFVAYNGWLQKSEMTVYEFLKELSELNVKNVIITDISKDGMLGGSNIELYKRIISEYDFDLTASGGISSYEELAELSSLNIYGAIIGKAYYEKKIDLKKALEITNAC